MGTGRGPGLIRASVLPSQSGMRRSLEVTH